VKVKYEKIQRKERKYLKIKDADQQRTPNNRDPTESLTDTAEVLVKDLPKPKQANIPIQSDHIQPTHT
jgi:hypothetical protein